MFINSFDLLNNGSVLIMFVKEFKNEFAYLTTIIKMLFFIKSYQLLAFIFLAVGFWFYF